MLSLCRCLLLTWDNDGVGSMMNGNFLLVNEGTNLGSTSRRKPQQTCGLTTATEILQYPPKWLSSIGRLFQRVPGDEDKEVEVVFNLLLVSSREPMEPPLLLNLTLLPSFITTPFPPSHLPTLPRTAFAALD